MPFFAELTVAYHRIAIHLDHESKYFHWFTFPREGLGKKRSKNVRRRSYDLIYKANDKAIRRKGTFTNLFWTQEKQF